MSKGSSRRPTDNEQELEDSWKRIFNSKPNSEQFEQHQKMVAWRDEMVDENHKKSLEDK